MILPIWSVALVISIIWLVPAFSTKSQGAYDFVPVFVGFLSIAGFIATWLCYFAYMIGVWTS